MLGPREREIFGMLAEGLNGQDIAERLFLSPEERADARAQRDGEAGRQDARPGRRADAQTCGLSGLSHAPHGRGPAPTVRHVTGYFEGSGTIRMYGFGDFQPSGYCSLRGVVGDRSGDDHVVALLPVRRRGDLVLRRELQRVETRSTSSKLRPVVIG